MLASTGRGFSNVRELVPDAVESAALTARTITVLGFGTMFGAVYKPDALIVPVAVFPPATPLTCHVTKVFEDPVMTALSDWVAPPLTVAPDGETLTVTPELAGGVLELDDDELCVAPVHPAMAAAAKRQTQR
jgi:hypothetical protein